MTRVVAAVLCTLLMATGAYAKTFYGQFSLSGSAFSDPGLVVNTYPSHGSGSFHLEAGESKHIDLFHIWTNEYYVNHDDKKPQSINAAFKFAGIGAGILSGTTVGSSYAYGLLQGGHVSWDNPLELAFGQGEKLILSLSDSKFNWGIFGTSPGYKHGANVKLKVTYEVAPVPLPASALLLLGGVAGLGLMRRRRKAA
ncbi:MAG: VPLPA-CTERM sorting domain-containing protein [Pseudomonadota bacterium]